MTPVEILKAAKAKIEDPAHWCQGASARDREGLLVQPEDPGACRWCVIGAISVVTGCDYDLSLTAHGFLTCAANEFGKPLAQEVNDETDHPTTMRFMDRAIALAEQEAK